MKTFFLIYLLSIPFIVDAQQIVLKSNAVINENIYSITLEKYNGSIFIWARKTLQQSNLDDIQILTVETKIIPSKDEAMKFICRSKNVYDNGKFALGCASVIGTGVCVATGGLVGVGAPVCIVTGGYMATTGAIDCVAGITEKIGSYFGYSDFGYAAEQAFGALSPSSFVSKALDQACSDWKAHK